MPIFVNLYYMVYSDTPPRALARVNNYRARICALPTLSKYTKQLFFSKRGLEPGHAGRY
jgi:hypothetical protein